MKKYWLVLSPDTFIWLKGENGLLYQSVNHTQILFKNEGTVRTLAGQLDDMDNLYRVELTEEMLRQPEVNAWVRQIEDKQCGRLLENSGTGNRPASMKPVLKLQDGVKYYEWLHRQGIDGCVIQNLHEVVFYLNGSASGDDVLHRQLVYPSTADAVADREKVIRFVKESKVSPFLSKISLAGNLLVFPHLVEMAEELQAICPVKLYITVEDALNGSPQLKEWADKLSVQILVKDFPSLEMLLDTNGWCAGLQFTLVVTSVQTYETATGIINKYGLEHADLVPAYTGENLPFFEDCIYPDAGELAGISLSKRDIFIRQTLNISDFGKLYIEPDGKVYANLDNAPLGMIDDSPHDLVYKELTEGHSWLHIRDQEPCRECVYQWLCPSPSNYERVIGKPDLCKMAMGDEA